MKEIKNFKLGITGGIACGKSTSMNVLQDLGWSVLDTDEVAHQIMRSGSLVFSEVVDHFGVEILAPNGEIDRPKLGRIVFSDDSALQRLNDLVHPHVHKEWTSWLGDQPGLAAVVIPLLYETGSETAFDEILCITSPEKQVLDRLRQRGLTMVESKKRILAQMPIEEKMARADIPIVNDGNLSELKKQLYAMHMRIEQKEKQQHG